MTKPQLLLCLCFYLFLATSCSNTKKALYFSNAADSSFASVNADVDPIIQKNDLLSISVSSANPEATIVFNTPNLQAISASNTPTSQTAGYLVSSEGSIKFPVLGNIQAAGLSKKQLTDHISEKLVSSKQLIDPIVNVRLLNFKVTVLGEVARPTVITVANEKISILEALGMAGDLTMYAKRDEIMLIREEGAKKIVRKINLNSPNALSSPYYYLQSNDVVYAEPNGTKVTATSGTRQLLPIIISGVSLVALLASRIL